MNYAYLKARSIIAELIRNGNIVGFEEHPGGECFFCGVIHTDVSSGGDLCFEGDPTHHCAYTEAVKFLEQS